MINWVIYVVFRIIMIVFCGWIEDCIFIVEININSLYFFGDVNVWYLKVLLYFLIIGKIKIKIGD